MHWPMCQACTSCNVRPRLRQISGMPDLARAHCALFLVVIGQKKSSRDCGEGSGKTAAMGWPVACQGLDWPASCGCGFMLDGVSGKTATMGLPVANIRPKPWAWHIDMCMDMCVHSCTDVCICVRTCRHIDMGRHVEYTRWPAVAQY